MSRTFGPDAACQREEFTQLCGPGLNDRPRAYPDDGNHALSLKFHFAKCAAERAASLADAVPLCGVRADTVKVSAPIGKGCVTRALLQPAPANWRPS